MCVIVISVFCGVCFKVCSVMYCVECMFSYCDGRRARIFLG